VTSQVTNFVTSAEMQLVHFPSAARGQQKLISLLPVKCSYGALSPGSSQNNLLIVFRWIIIHIIRILRIADTGYSSSGSHLRAMAGQVGKRAQTK